MSQPAHFAQVIERVIQRNAEKGLTPADLAAAIVDGLDLVDALLSDAPPATASERARITFPGMNPLSTLREEKANVRIQTLAPEQVYPAINTGSAILIGDVSEEAPPSIVRNPGSTSVQDSYAETEEKKSELVAKAINLLPVSLTVDLPIVGQLTLTRFVKRAPEGVEVVRVLFALTAEDEDAPQVQLVTGKPFDPEIVLRDIRTAAAMRYRKTKPVIVPRVPQHPGIPDFENMAVKPTAADLAPTSEADLQDWRRLSGSTRI